MKRLVLALILIPAFNALISVSRADLAASFATPHSTHNSPGPASSQAKLSSTRSPSPAASSSPSASEAPTGLINSGLAMAIVTTTSLIGIVVIRKRDDYQGSR